MKHTYFLFLFCISITSLSFAQLDGNNQRRDRRKSSSIGIINAPAREVNKPNSLEFGNDNGFKTAHKQQQKKKEKEQAEKTFENKGIITPALRRKIRLQKQVEKYNFQIPMIDKNIGSFRTKSSKINVQAFDFGQIDGDVITIYKNGISIVSNYTLRRKSKMFSIPLDIGFNKIEIVATHEGTLRPNTGAFTVFDNFGKTVISDNWTLAKGAKVIALIIREKNQKQPP